MAYPQRYVVDPQHAGDDRMKKCVEACDYDAIELDMQPRTITAKVGAIVWATGWKPYDATKLDNLGFGELPNVITNVMMERYASENGPTEGKIVRPSDGGEITKIGFVQCAGSRDENHLPYCSSICCLASMKQATYVRERYPDAEVHMFYIDVRAPGRMEDFYTKVKDDEKFFFHRGKVAKITEGSEQQRGPRGGEHAHRRDHQDGGRPGGSRHRHGSEHGQDSRRRWIRLSMSSASSRPMGRAESSAREWRCGPSTS